MSVNPQQRTWDTRVFAGDDAALSAPPPPAPAPSPGPAPAEAEPAGGTEPPAEGSAGGGFLRRFRRGRSGSTASRDGRSIVVANDGGGYGKTTIALLMGLQLAQAQDSEVLAIDAAPGYGSLADRASRDAPPGTVRSLIDSEDDAVTAHTLQLPGGLEVLASDNSATVASILTADDYRALLARARRHYDTVITDCSAGLTSPVVTAALAEADALVIVSEGGGGVRSTTWMANYLTGQARQNPALGRLLADAVIVVNAQHAHTNTNVETVVRFYKTIARTVVQVGFDGALEGGVVIAPEALSATTGWQVQIIAQAAMEAAAATASR